MTRVYQSVTRGLDRPVLAAPPVAAWDPTDQTGLILDLDADTISTMLDAVAGSPVTDGVAVANWLDQDANGVEFRTVGGTFDPTYHASTGGQPSVEFAISDRLMASGANGNIQVGTDDYTIYTVIQPVSITNGVASYYMDSQTGRLILALVGGGTVDGVAYYDGAWKEEAVGVLLTAAKILY